MDNAIEISNLFHRYGRRIIYDGLNFSVPQGKVFGLLGKNGVGKTTLIKILMGFLRPSGGTCRILGDESHALTPETRRRVGLLFEGHLTYEFMTIESIEKFFAPFYPKWNRDYYYDLVDRLALPGNHKIADMSEGQSSQVVLGLIMAQQPDVMILDDYTMGLDAGYRRLFLDHLTQYLKEGDKTVLVTSHIVQDLESLVDEIIFLERGGLATQVPMQAFMHEFKQFDMQKNGCDGCPPKGGPIKNVEETNDCFQIFSFEDKQIVARHLAAQGFPSDALEQRPLSLEDAFIGFTGRY